jgi:hypothetical protein
MSIYCKNPNLRMASCLASLLAFLLISWPVRAQETQTVGLFYNDGATDGYTLFAPFRGIGTYLVDNGGVVVHEWQEPDGLTPGASVYLTPEGTLLRAVRTEGGGGDGGRLREYDWDGNCIWEFRYDKDMAYAERNVQQHHDFELLPNGNLLITASEYGVETLVEVIKGAGVPNPEYGDETADFADNTAQYILDGTKADFVPVWKWSVGDHVTTANDPYGFAPGLQINFNHVDYLPERDHILVGSNRSSEILIIDHATGDLLWRWGNPANYGAPGRQKLSFQHSVHWVASGYGYHFSPSHPAYGDIILFNNSDPKQDPYSSVVQITPPWNGTSYEMMPNGAFGPDDWTRRIKKFRIKDENGKTVWYQFDGNWQGSAQMFPNGNVLITIGGPTRDPGVEMMTGTSFEVTPDNESIWRYVNPYVNTPSNAGPKGPDTELGETDPIPICPFGPVSGPCNFVFRAIRYSL